MPEPGPADRTDAIQSLLDLYPDPAYLEIGLGAGELFLRTRAARKVLADPLLKPDVKAAIEAQAGAVAVALGGDRFFAEAPEANERFDVIFLDGAHQFEATLRDFMNALESLKPGGVVVVDDVAPNSFAAALPSYDETRGVRGFFGDPDTAWMGDVYRLVFFIESFLQPITWRTIAESHGQLVAWKRRRPAYTLPPRTVEEVARTPFQQTVLDGRVFRRAPLAEILDEVRAHRAAAG